MLFFQCKEEVERGHGPVHLYMAGRETREAVATRESGIDHTVRHEKNGGHNGQFENAVHSILLNVYRLTELHRLTREG